MGLLLQVPPVVASVMTPVMATHTVDGPLMAPGPGVIVSVRVATQPVGSVYVMVAVPVTTPVTTPLDEPIATVEGSLLLHDPPADASVSVALAPAHSVARPVMAPGSGLTVSIAVTEQPGPSE